MALVPMRLLLDHAAENGYGIPAFNVNNMEQIQAIIPHRYPFLLVDRIVEIEMRNPRIAGDERRLLHDFMIWRRELESVKELGAYRTLERPLSVARSNPEPVTVAEISASAFQLARVPPILGRPLIEADEALAAGLVNELADDHTALMQRAEAITREVAANAPLTLQATKEALLRLRPSPAHGEGNDLVEFAHDLRA